MVEIVDAGEGWRLRELTWLQLDPGPDQSMTLLPDDWGPTRGCPTCKAAWSHVVALGVAARMMELKGQIDVHPTAALVLVTGPAVVPAWAAVIKCVDGHYAMVESDGRLTGAVPGGLGANVPLAYGQIAAFYGRSYVW